MKPIIIKRFADNGDLSHYSVVDKETGKTLIEDIEEKSKRCPLYMNYEKSCMAIKKYEKELERRLK